jgi:uncharacterized protein YkwD
VKNKIGWLLIVVEFSLIGWIGTRYWNEIKNLIGLFKPITTEIRTETAEIPKEIEEEIPTATLISPTTKIKKNIPTSVTIKKIYPTIISDDTPWGVAQQIDDVTWTIKIGQDEKMATPREIWEALNQYRKVQGSQILNWDTKLADYAQSRSKYLNSKGTTDKHEGFSNFLNNEDGFNKLGFTSLGENISYGYKLNGVHTIEWMYAGDKPHNDNQLDNRWNYVGIGVDGLATCLIFGTGKF